MDVAAMDTGASAGSHPDPLLRDLHEKKQNLRRIASEVGSMAAELRDARSRMEAQDMALAQETSRRQSAEARMMRMEKELNLVQRSSVERSSQASHACEQQFDTRIQLGGIEGPADGTLELQCGMEIRGQIDTLKEGENHIRDLEGQISELHQELKKMGVSQQYLRDELKKFQLDVKLIAGKSIARIDNEFKKILEEFILKNVDQIAKYAISKDDEISRLKEEAKLISTQLKFKAQDLEVQLQKQCRADQELKNRVIKLELWLQETRSQTRKLLRISEKRGKEIEDLRTALWMKQKNSDAARELPTLWDMPRLKISLLSVSLVFLAFLAKR